MFIKGTGGFGNKRTSGARPDNYIIKISQDTEKSPEDFRRIAVTLNSMKDYKQTVT